MTKRNAFLGNKAHDYDPVWQVQLAVAGALALQLLLPDQLVAGPKYILVGLEAVLLIILALTTPRLPEFRSRSRRASAVALIVLIGSANLYSLARVADQLLAGGRVSNGRELLLAAVNIYLTNVIIFGVFYWELDGGGPGHRRSLSHRERDFLFPQMLTPELGQGWHPTVLDYLYVSATNATAFSPTDTMPLTRRAKALMLVQALASLAALALVAARAVNILS
jgi:uncharacterized membrane protein